MKKRILIVGGTSGLGLEIAKRYTLDAHTVCVTGRKNPNLPGATYQELAIGHEPSQLAKDIDRVLSNFENVNTLVYAAGFLQRGHIDEFSDGDLGAMVNVGLLAPAMLVQRLKRLSRTPIKVMLVTSSSQYTPREFEPMYCATKSALAMLGASLVRDREIGKVLVVAPSGIKTPFWQETKENTDTMLDPKWVSDKTIELSGGNFRYKFAKILRDPMRVEVVECLDHDLAII